MTMDDGVKALAQDVAAVVKTKAELAHTHTASQVTDFSAAADARITASTTVVKTSGAQTIAGVKTFSSSPAVPNNAFTIAKTSGLQAALDAKVDSLRKRVVVIGSSNALPNTWPEKFMALMGWTSAAGWTLTNTAVGGSAYTTTGTSSFTTQLNSARTAIGETARLDVGVVFITDASNDTRAKSTAAAVRSGAATAISLAKTNFPNARVVIVPLIWPSDAKAYWPQNALGYAYPMPFGPILLDQMRELRDQAATLGAEFIDQSWTWLTGDDSYMQLLQDVHPGPTGYTEVAKWVAKYFRNEPTVAHSRWYEATIPNTAYFAPADVPNFQRLGGYVDGWTAYVSGTVKSLGATGAASDFALLHKHLRPEQNVSAVGYSSASNAAISVTVWQDGTIRANTPIAAAGSLTLSATYSLY